MILSKIFNLAPGEIISNIKPSNFDGFCVLTEDKSVQDFLPENITIASYKIDENNLKQKIKTKKNGLLFIAPDNFNIPYSDIKTIKLSPKNINFVYLGKILKQKNCYYVWCFSSVGCVGWFRYE